MTLGHLPDLTPSLPTDNPAHAYSSADTSLTVQLATKVAELMRIDDFTLQDLATTLITLAKKVTNSNWAEFLYVEGDALVICTTTSGRQREVLQGLSRLPLSEDSAAGYCALHKEPMIVNNTAASQLYSGFKYRLTSFSKAMTAESPQTIVCLPVFSKDSKVFGVIQVFDKVEESQSLGRYNDTDLALLEAVANLFSGILTMRHSEKISRKYCEQLEYFNTQRHNVTGLSLQLARQESLLQALEQVLASSKCVTYEFVDLMAEAMSADAVLIHLISREKVVCPWIAFGIKLNCGEEHEVKALCTRTSEYLLTDATGCLQVRDYSKEKHFSSAMFAHWDKRFTTSLSLPICDDGMLLGVVEFYRSTNEFTFRDEHAAKNILSFLSGISANRYISRLPLSGLQDKISTRLITQYGLKVLQSIREFSMSRDSFHFDFVRYLRQIRNSLRDLLKLESCSLYIRDAVTDSVWTWVSYNCEPIRIPIVATTLLGYSVIKKQVINEQFPCGVKELDVLTNIQALSREAILVVPVLGEVLKNQVLAVVIVSRKDLKFTPEEVALVSKLMRVASFTLENLFFTCYDLKDSSPEFDESQGPASPKIRKKDRLVSLASFRAPMRTLDEPEYASKVKRSRTVTETDEEDEDARFPTLRNICQIAAISAERFEELRTWLEKVDERPEEAMALLLHELPVLVPCQKAKIFILHSSRMYLKDMESDILSTPLGLIKQVYTSGSFIKLNTAVESNPNYVDTLDSLGITGTIDTFLAVPIFHMYEEVIGVMVFANSKTCFSEEDLAVAQFLTLIPSKAILTQDDGVKKWSDVLKEGLRQEMLLAWTKQIVSVSAVCQQTITKLKDIAYSLVNTSDFQVVMKALIEVICANMNVEEAQVLIRHSDGYIASFTRLKGLQLVQPGEQLEFIKQVFQTGKSFTTLNDVFGWVNVMIVPVRSGPDIVGGLLLCNKKDASLSFHCSFTNEDHVIAQRYSIKLADPVTQWAKDDKADTLQLRRMINTAAANIQAYPLMNVIRKAALQLLDCDRSTVYIRENDQMVVIAQGIENEIPEGYSVPLGVGIIGYVAQSRQAVSLEDAYNDPRFNKQIDAMTGYHTSSVLCVPVVDSAGEVIAALQLINKRRGTFNVDDLKIVDMFSEVISSALQIYGRFKSMVGENMQLLNVLNSIQTYIFVINKEGKLSYCNEKFAELFGYAEEVGKTRHFSYWLRDNPSLLKDIQSVLDSPDSKVSREFQSLHPSRAHRSSSAKALSVRCIEGPIQIHYNITSMQDFTTQEPIGLILIIEDVTKIVKMKTDLQKAKSKLKELTGTNAVKAETGLYTCITSLQQLYDSLATLTPSQTLDSLAGVISILKAGNLEKAEVYFSAGGSQADNDLRLFIDKEFLGRDQETLVEGHLGSVRVQPELQGAQGLSNVSLLHTWSLNVWDLGDTFPHIVSMLADLNLIAHFDIKSTVLSNFLTETKRRYDHNRNPFHNFLHGFSVMHSMYFLLTSTKAGTWFATEELFAILLAALCHDVDHTGRTNSFEVSKGSTLALRYHDIAVLEQHHAATTFFILTQENCNILETCPRDVYFAIRKVVIAGILATDMSKHFPMLLKMQVRFKDMQEAPIGAREHDKMDMVELLVHCCDLAHITKSFSICSRWSQLLRQEMISQVKDEVALGLPVTAFMRDLEDIRSFCKNEVNFTTVIVQPLWECVNQGLQPYTEQQLKNLADNIQAYKEQLAKEEAATS